MNKTLKFSIIVVNWNASHQLKDCILSIEKYHHNLVDSVIIIDNASTDDSLYQVKSLLNLPFKIEYINNDINEGFGKASNQGALRANGEYLLFLNPDAALHANSLPKAFEYMEDTANSKVGICGVQLVDKYGEVSRHCARFHSVTSYFSTAIGLDRVFPQLGHLMAEWDHAKTQEVDHVIGAFFLVRHTVFSALQGFDEQFFVYLEDLDFSYRARQAGWLSVYLAEVRAFHAGGGTSSQIKARRLFYSLRSRLIYVFKHFTLPSALAVALVTLLVEPITRTALGLARRSCGNLKETWVGYGLLWAWLPSWVFKGETR